MFIIPPKPCASYLAPGFVITSIVFIWLAGIDCNTSVMLLPNAVDGLPFIKKRTPPLPESCTFPSTSTETCGIFLRISVATPDCELTSFSALNTSLSILLSISFVLEVTTTSSILPFAGNKKIFLKSIGVLEMVTFFKVNALYPINSKTTV